MKVSHSPRQCLTALARTVGPVVVDLETTGLHRCDQIVSAGLLVDGIAYILFARSSHVSVTNLPLDAFREAIRPLEERKDLVIIGHNFLFDLRFLLREGIRVGGDIHDTLKLLRLLDQDRGGERGCIVPTPAPQRPQGPGECSYVPGLQTEARGGPATRREDGVLSRRHRVGPIWCSRYLPRL